MNKYETIASCLDDWQMGFMGMPYHFDRIVTAWCEDNGGRLEYDDLVEMVEYIEQINWWSMAHFMQGYFWGAAIDDLNELAGEQYAKIAMA